MTTLITGASGFLGSHLAALLSADEHVIAIGRRPYSTLHPYRQQLLSHCSYHQLDLSKQQEVTTFFLEHLSASTNNTLYHLAWSGKSQLSDTSAYYQFLNLSYSLNLFRLANQYSFKKFLFSGTMEEFIADQYVNLDFSSQSSSNRHVIYALAKQATRSQLVALSSSFSTDLYFVCNSHLMGPGDTRDSFLQCVLVKLAQNADINMSTGTQLFDTIDVRDCASAYRYVATNGTPLSYYHAGNPSPVPLRDIVFELRDILRSSSNIYMSESISSDRSMDSSSFSSLHSLSSIGFRQTYNLETSSTDLLSILHLYESSLS